MTLNKNQTKPNYLLLLGKIIKDRRNQLQMSQEELSVKSEIHRTYLSAIEKGKKNITLLSIIKIAKALEIKISDLLDISQD